MNRRAATSTVALRLLKRSTMSRLDQHVRRVQNRLAMLRLVEALVWSVIAFGAGLTLVILVERTARLSIPRPVWFFWGAVAACGFAALVYAIFKRPTPQYAAVAIDEKLGLKEKISTALY